MGKTDMGRMEEYLRSGYQKPTNPTTRIETPFVDTSKDVEYLPHFKRDTWMIAESYKIKTTMETCIAWAEYNKNFANTNAIERLTKNGLTMFFCGFCEDYRVAQFMYMVGIEPEYLMLPIKIYMRGTVEIYPV